jgi:hypothetical protein
VHIFDTPEDEYLLVDQPIGQIILMIIFPLENGSVN